MFKKQEPLLNDVVGGAAIGIAVGMIMEKVLSPRTPVANSSTYGMHSPVQWQSGSNQLQYVPNQLYCDRVYPSPCKHHKVKHCNNGLHSEYEDSYVYHSKSTLRSSRKYNISTDEYTVSSEVFSHISYDSTRSTSHKSRTSTSVASSQKPEDSLTRTNKNTTLIKKQASSESKADTSKKQNVKEDLKNPGHKRKVNSANELSVRNCGDPRRKIEKARTDLPKKNKVPSFEISSKSKTVHCSKNESDTIKPKVSIRSQGVQESVKSSKVVKSLADLNTKPSKSETLVKFSKEKILTEKSKHHGIKSSTILNASSSSQTKDLQSLSETGNLATCHLTNYIDLEFSKTETSCSNIQNEKDNIRDLLGFW